MVKGLPTNGGKANAVTKQIQQRVQEQHQLVTSPDFPDPPDLFDSVLKVDTMNAKTNLIWEN
jgi:hypothetical protein